MIATQWSFSDRWATGAHRAIGRALSRELWRARVGWAVFALLAGRECRIEIAPSNRRERRRAVQLARELPARLARTLTACGWHGATCTIKMI